VSDGIWLVSSALAAVGAYVSPGWVSAAYVLGFGLVQVSYFGT
jgi:hypothetical protein